MRTYTCSERPKSDSRHNLAWWTQKDEHWKRGVTTYTAYQTESVFIMYGQILVVKTGEHIMVLLAPNSKCVLNTKEVTTITCCLQIMNL